MGNHKRVEGEFLSGRLYLPDEADVGGIVEGAWENVYAGRRNVGSFVSLLLHNVRSPGP